MRLPPAQPYEDACSFDSELHQAHVTMFIADVIFNIMGI